MIIKICGIKHAETAYVAAAAGAQFIGILCAFESKRYVNLKTACEIAEAARNGGAEPVAIFTNSSAETMLSVCKAANIQWVQLHGSYSRKAHVGLPADIHRIYASSVLPIGTLKGEDLVDTKDLDPYRDFLLFDSAHAGSGQVFDWKHFSYRGPFRWLLSGGLNSNNVRHAIDILHPTGVDVSSGVEDAYGTKTVDLILNFIHGVQHESVSAS